jgi:hypothetical protein
MLAGVCTVIALAGIFMDVIIGNITGGDLTALPQTAAERFNEFNTNKLIGLYHLDLLNVMVQILLVPAYIALYVIHSRMNRSFGLLALIIFLFGSVIMVANNTALPMMELSDKYFLAETPDKKILFAAAGEAMLAMGAHGSAGIFPGFFIPNIAGLIISIVMLRGKIFNKTNSWFGIVGSLLMLVYVVLVNFAPGVDKMATAFAMPGGILLMIWMIMLTEKLFRLSKI